MKKLTKNKKRKNGDSKISGGSYPEESYNKKISDLHLDKEVKALPNASKRKNGKDIPVNIQIIDYLKDMMLLEKNIKKLSKDSFRLIVLEEAAKILSESKIKKRRYNGKIYKTTNSMVKLVKKQDSGKISYKKLREIVSKFSDIPDDIIISAKIVANIKPYYKKTK